MQCLICSRKPLLDAVLLETWLKVYIKFVLKTSSLSERFEWVPKTKSMMVRVPAFDIPYVLLYKEKLSQKQISESRSHGAASLKVWGSLLREGNQYCHIAQSLYMLFFLNIFLSTLPFVTTGILMMILTMMLFSEQFLFYIHVKEKSTCDITWDQ